MAGWPSSAVLLTPKEGGHESSRVGLTLPRPPWGDDGLPLGGLHIKARVKLLVMKRHRSQGGSHHSASPRRKKKKKTPGKLQEARLPGSPQTGLHGVLVFGIINLLRTGAPVYKKLRSACHGATTDTVDPGASHQILQEQVPIWMGEPWA